MMGRTKGTSSLSAVLFDRHFEIREFGKKFGDRIAEQKSTLFPQHHCGDRNDGLGHGIDAKDAVPCHRCSAGGVALTEAFEITHAPAARDQHDGAGNAPSFDLVAHFCAKTRKPGAGETDILGCGQRQGA